MSLFTATSIPKKANGVRNTVSFEKEYLMGKYGAVPNNLNVVEEAVENYLTNAQADKANKED